MPLSTPIRGVDGKLMTEIFVPKGTMILVSNWLSNINKAIWGEDADQWKPERWLNPLPAGLDDARIPGVYSNMFVFSCSCPSSCSGPTNQYRRMTACRSPVVLGRALASNLPN